MSTSNFTARLAADPTIVRYVRRVGPLVAARRVADAVAAIEAEAVLPIGNIPPAEPERGSLEWMRSMLAQATGYDAEHVPVMTCGADGATRPTGQRDADGAEPHENPV